METHHQLELIGFEDDGPDESAEGYFARSWVHDTSEPWWIEELVDTISWGDRAVVVDRGRVIYIPEMKLHPRQSIWDVLWIALTAAGVRAPRDPK